MSSGKTRLMEVQKGSDQTLCVLPNFLSHMSICRRHFSGFLHNLKAIYEYRYMKKADLEKHCLLLNKLGFPRQRHKWNIYALLDISCAF